MRTIDYNLNADKNGGKITAFRYTHGLNELCGSWSAEAAKGTFTAGDFISFGNVLSNGIISRVYKDSDGLWHIEGYDAGIRLMQTTPEIADLPEGNAKTVIQKLATLCGVSLNMSGNGLSGFNVRSLISGTTCAEAILELAMFSGMVAFINNSGTLTIQAPANTYSPPTENIIDNSGSDIDLDGYATRVTILLSRKPEDEEEDEQVHYIGKTPSTSTKTTRYSGSFSNGSYSYKILEPFNVIAESNTIITENGVTIETTEEHEYDYKHKTIWRGNQEYVLFAFYEKGYELTKEVSGTYTTAHLGNLTFTEKTTETMTRSLSHYDAVGVPSDWAGELDMVDTETITRSTVRTGGKAPSADMPSYTPPFDTKIVRTYSRGLRGTYVACNETEERYESRQVGSIFPVKVNGEAVPHFMLGSNLAIQTHSSPEWVKVNTYRTYYEQYNSDGECVVSTKSEYSDNGSDWLAAHALNDTGDDDLNEYEKAYAKFSQDTSGLEVSLGSSVLTSVWQFMELPGREKSTVDDEDAAVLSNVENWYDNGEYISSSNCPHYESSNSTCMAYALASVSDGNYCIHNRRNYWWKDCSRAKAALTLARERDKAIANSVIVGVANSSGGAAVGYKREIYIDDNLTGAQAQTIANTIAANVLAVKGTKGLRKTIQIPYDSSIQPNGAVVEVSHDWQNLTTSVTYKTSEVITDFLVSRSVSSIAAFVSARDTARLNAPRYGVISDKDGSEYSVKIGNNIVKCTTKLKNLGKGDTVLVSFPSGNKLRGQVISRL